MTSYYEPLIRVSSVQTPAMPEPIQSRPADLITLNAADFDPALTGRTLVGRLQGNQLVPYRTRAEITPQSAPVLAWGSMGDVLALQIQGSGRLIFDDGRQMRTSFTATNGHPFRSTAQELIRRGFLERNRASADAITQWFAGAEPGVAREVMNANPRTVFFEMRPVTDPNEGPRGGAGLGLEPGGSGAVDLRYHPYGVPFFVAANAPVLANSPDATIHRLLVAQDTGGAIRGPLRVDLFWGTGDEAGLRAGRVNHDVRWWILLPNGLDPVASGRR
jgi:membrane-bound lytic murein transglycosylase A